MIRQTLLALVLAATPALAQQPAQQPAHTTAAQRPDTTKAKARRTHRMSRTRTTKAKPAPAAPRDTTTKP
jgi:hypothetical protein